MTVHITNLYGMAHNSVAQIAQNAITNIATQNLHFDPFSIYDYSWPDEPADSRNARFDGIIASLSNNDTVIFQSPSWNSIEWDTQFIDHIFAYKNVKKIIFIEDVVPLMFESNLYLLPKFINFYNKADLLIVASKKLYDFLRVHGLHDKKYVIQGLWDHVTTVNPFVKPKNNKIISFAGNPEKFTFVKDWNHSDVKLQVYSDNINLQNNQNLIFMGWQDDPMLLESLRRTGGFGLVWTEDEYTKKYMSMNACYKLSTYLAAGIPLIVHTSLATSNLIERKHLGIVADSLNEAVDKVKKITDSEYNELVSNVDDFAMLVREGYFTKRALTEAVFKVHYE